MQAARLAKLVPQPVLNNVLLSMPWLYRTRFVCYESYLSDCSSQIVGSIEDTKNVEGDLIECGSARCGTAVIMGNYLKANGIKKRVYACDSFGAGYDPDELEEDRRRGLTRVDKAAYTYNSLAYVRKKIHRLELDDFVIPVPGFFKDTLPRLDGKFAFALIDCGLGASARYCLWTLWPKLSPHAEILVDDYQAGSFRGIKLAVDDFVARNEEEISTSAPLRLFTIKKK